MGFIEELQWRGLIHDTTPGLEDLFNQERVKGYVGFDPTADSLHIGSLVPIMLLVHLQRHGHSPIALVGGATGLIGDPSGKSNERNLLTEDVLAKNLAGIRKQLEHFLEFEHIENPAEVVNNYDWFKPFSFLGFIRDVGKYITVNYMMAKESVKQRINGEVGLSFTEFSYQLIQGYDFVWLFQNKGVKLQMGGSDQWGNITTGTEMIRKMLGGDAFALTAPLVKKADGGKFGKTEQGNVWLDPERTSPYRFYQFWLNASDDDAIKWIKIFTLIDQLTIETLIAQHSEAPHLRILQKAMAEDITIRVHSKEEYERAVMASEILFGKSDVATLEGLDAATLSLIASEVSSFTISSDEITKGIPVLDILATHSSIYASKGEARRAIQSNAVSINQTKVSADNISVDASYVLKDRYILIKKGKKDYFMIEIQ